MPRDHFHVGDHFSTARAREEAERTRVGMVEASRPGYPEVPEVRACRCETGERVLLERAAPRLHELLAQAYNALVDSGVRYDPSLGAAIHEVFREAGEPARPRRLLGDHEAEINARLGLDEDEECSECGEPLTDDGEGFADLCPACADATEPTDG